ncbi:aldehyde dehydrogenase family protein [Halodurantibacterium flavum]|uniref:Aldehyde dehydrogenase family protein n=1 Tax=Halodurantibacterium flavum TaxID=1382802 RepID=A0ABW4S428_9RHOB
MHGTLGQAGHFIGGEWIEEGVRAESVDPSSGQVLGHYLAGSAALADQAVSAARSAFFGTTWQSTPRLRAAVLLEFADRLEADSAALIDLIIAENGKLRIEATGEVALSVSELRYYAGLARNLFGRTLESDTGKLSLLNREPIGVAAVIVPWNAPVALLIRSLAPALAVGCTCVVKPAPQTPLINDFVLRRLLACAGLPAGVVNTVNESGYEVGEALALSNDVDVISFTGSSRTGARIMATAAPTLKRLSLELGGKAPAIVFDDADLDLAVRELTRGSLVMAGQMCVAAARFLVHDRVYDAFRDRIAGVFSSLKVGPGAAADSQMGPIIDHGNRDRILALVEQAAEEGRLVVRGKIPDGSLSQGAFVTPSLFEIDDVASPLVQEEIFGPLISLERFSDEAGAVSRANATRYGLAASIFTADIHRAMRVSRALRTGTVWLNCHNRLIPEAETGGYGHSGLGRLHGVEGLNDFLETKHVYLESGAI